MWQETEASSQKLYEGAILWPPAKFSDDALAPVDILIATSMRDLELEPPS